MAKDKNDQEIDLNKYKDLDGLSLKKMNFGLWLSESRGKIMKIIIILLIALSAFFFIYSSYNYFIYFLVGDNKESEIAFSNSSVLSPRKVVSELIISEPKIFKSGETYDLVTLLKNPNDKFIGTFEYCFSGNEKIINCSGSFILPGEEKYVFSLGQKIDDASTIVFKVNNMVWQRVDNRQIPNWSSFASNRLNFGLENINLALARESGLSEKLGFNSLEFTINNRTAFGYYEVPLSIALYSGSELVGFNSYVLKDFLAGETKNVRLSWLGGLENVSRTEIRPVLNILDDSIYLKYQGSPQVK